MNNDVSEKFLSSLDIPENQAVYAHKIAEEYISDQRNSTMSGFDLWKLRMMESDQLWHDEVREIYDVYKLIPNEEIKITEVVKDIQFLMKNMKHAHMRKYIRQVLADWFFQESISMK